MANFIYVSKKCGDFNVTGVAMYRVGAEISAYDYGEKGTFVLLGNAGPELIGRQASELFDNYSEGNGDMGANHEMTAPQCMDTTGQTHKFSLQLELFSNETNHKCDKWCLSFCSSTYKSRSSTPGAVNVCNTAIGGTCSTWSLAEPSASSKESVVQDKAKYKTSLNQPQSRNPNHGCLIESLSISKLLPSLSFFSYLPPFLRL
ncbi:hypothetical protein IGI04_012757 [Brassica rapa subsp. trilocularis]|uniref:Uncharacterized protein n=1 Tax=Brassica rapa subsp. trilocularis TaxID=1813537 RepID=A0ABQ7N6V6_BRACM|nr:hypothetical protein IGI04_012757 [Brassica rapa subsp. trilocularis]